MKVRRIGDYKFADVSHLFGSQAEPFQLHDTKRSSLVKKESGLCFPSGQRLYSADLGDEWA